MASRKKAGSLFTNHLVNENVVKLRFAMTDNKKLTKKPTSTEKCLKNYEDFIGRYYKTLYISPSVDKPPFHL